MKNKKIIDSWNKIQPSDAASERMLNNILSQARHGHTNKRTVSHMNTNLKIFATLAACIIIALAVAVPSLMMRGNGSPDSPALPGPYLAVNTPQPIQQFTPTPTPMASHEAAPPTPAPLPQFELVFNQVTEPTTSIMACRPMGFTLELNRQQLNAMFPLLDDTYLSAWAFYLHDGTFTDATAIIDDENWSYIRRWTRIQVARYRVMQTLIMVFPDPPQVSYVHGVPVVAYIQFDPEFSRFQAEFMIDDIAYLIELTDRPEEGKRRMSQLVYQIIQGGPADLSVLELDTAGIMHESMTLAAARQVPGLGAYLPDSRLVPYGFAYASRTVNPTLNQVSTHWGYAVDRFLSWTVSMAEYHDLTIYAAEDNPIFNSQDISLQDMLDVAYAAENNFFIGMPMRFTILHDDVVIWVVARGMTPEAVWAILEGLF